MGIDRTGLGREMGENAVNEFGSRVELIDFTNQSKEVMAYDTKDAFSNHTLIIPDNPNVINSLASIKKGQTESGLPRFDAQRTEETGHADYFWALSVLLQSAKGISKGPLTVVTGKGRESRKMLKGYD